MRRGDLKIVFHEPWRKNQPHRVELRHNHRLVGEGGGITQAEALLVLQRYLTGSGAPDDWVQMVEPAGHATTEGELVREPAEDLPSSDGRGRPE